MDEPRIKHHYPAGLPEHLRETWDSLAEIPLEDRALSRVLLHERAKRELGHRAELDAMRAALLAEIADEQDDLRTALHSMVESETTPCRFDHKGYCQEHLVTKPCAVAHARALLGLEDVNGDG